MYPVPPRPVVAESGVLYGRFRPRSRALPGNAMCRRLRLPVEGRSPLGLHLEPKSRRIYNLPTARKFCHARA